MTDFHVTLFLEIIVKFCVNDMNSVCIVELSVEKKLGLLTIVLIVDFQNMNGPI